MIIYVKSRINDLCVFLHTDMSDFSLLVAVVLLVPLKAYVYIYTHIHIHVVSFILQ